MQRFLEYMSAKQAFNTRRPPQRLTVPLRGPGPFEIRGESTSLALSATKDVERGALESFDLTVVSKIEVRTGELRPDSGQQG